MFHPLLEVIKIGYPNPNKIFRGSFGDSTLGRYTRLEICEDNFSLIIGNKNDETNFIKRKIDDARVQIINVLKLYRSTIV